MLRPFVPFVPIALDRDDSGGRLLVDHEHAKEIDDVTVDHELRNKQHAESMLDSIRACWKAGSVSKGCVRGKLMFPGVVMRGNVRTL